MGKPANKAKTNPGARVRARAAAAVAQVLGPGRRLEDSLDYEGLSASDRALLRELATGTVRWAHRLRALLGDLLDRPLSAKEADVEAVLLVGLHQLAHTEIAPYAAVSATVDALPRRKAWAGRLVNGVLRRFQRERDARLMAVDEQGPAVATAHPQWLVERIQADHPDHWSAILAANNKPPPLTLRVSGDRDAYLAELAAAGIAAEPLEAVPTAVRLAEFLPVGSLPGFAEGRVSVQDGAAQLAAPLLDPREGEVVLDACTAPGGKLAHLLEWAPGARVVGVEAERKRLARVQETIERTGRRPAALLQGDAAHPEGWWDGVPVDRILLDAPCSGTGVIRRHPDIKHLRRSSDIPALADQQRALLEGLWPLLRPGGTLLYATCSLLAAENREPVTGFLEAHPEATAETLPGPWGHPSGPGRQILPGEEAMDGFFFARLVKEGGG